MDFSTSLPAPVSNVCEAGLRSLFWACKGLNEFPEMCFEFHFNTNGYPWCLLIWGPEQGFRRWLADGLNQRFSFVSGKGYPGLRTYILYSRGAEARKNSTEVATLPHKMFYHSF